VKFDVIVAGVGGQGVLAVAAIFAEAARREGLEVKQSEVHGMAQRGGAVQATLRMSSEAIASELVAIGGAQMIIGLEPVEALRYLDHLEPGGLLLTATDPVSNITDYPPIETVHEHVVVLGGHLVEANRIAREAGSARAANMVMVGAASTRLPLSPAVVEDCIRDGFAAKGDKIVGINVEAFRAGRAVVPAPSR
jgi:indolepyruvate ferredoxin oxidoreductase beta subunit